MRAYADAMKREMVQYAEAAGDTVFDTVFFGGGTPSLLPVSVVAELLEKANTLFRIEKDAEITLEANPATADDKKLKDLKSVGINRLSVGVQSLIDEELSYLGRLHSSREALSFLYEARSVGYDNINVDLMYGIPSQTVESAEKTLEEVIKFSPEHISAYSLMLEEGTPLYEKRKTLPIPSEEEEDAIDITVRSLLDANGYLHYEISNYAKPKRESRHNLHYWHSDPYLGFGVSAYSYFGGVRYGNHTSLTDYLADPTHAVSEREVINEASLAYEWIMLRLRLKEGISLSEYRARFGVDFKVKYSKEIERFHSQGMMREDGDRIFLTERGFRLSNSILVAFLEDEKNC